MLCRFHEPWPELQQWVDAIDLEKVDEVSHSHTPYGAPPALHSLKLIYNYFRIRSPCCSAHTPQKNQVAS